MLYSNPGQRHQSIPYLASTKTKQVQCLFFSKTISFTSLVALFDLFSSLYSTRVTFYILKLVQQNFTSFRELVSEPEPYRFRTDSVPILYRNRTVPYSKNSVAYQNVPYRTKTTQVKRSSRHRGQIKHSGPSVQVGFKYGSPGISFPFKTYKNLINLELKSLFFCYHL